MTCRAKLAKPPRCELVQSKWMVENKTDKCEVTPKMNETIYILGCVGATIRITDKCKSIIVDGCKKTNVIFDKCVSTCEVVNCKYLVGGSFIVDNARSSACRVCPRSPWIKPTAAPSSSLAAAWRPSAFSRVSAAI